MSITFALILSLILTLAIELPLSLLFHVRRKGLVIVLLVNILTNPAAVFICYLTQIYLQNGWYNPVQFTVEILVFIIEAVIYRQGQKLSELELGTHPFCMSLCLNLASWSCGLVLQFLRSI